MFVCQHLGLALEGAYHMFRILLQAVLVIAMPVLIIYAFYKGLRGSKKAEIYSPFDDSTRGTTYPHDDTTPPNDTRHLVESEQVVQYEESAETEQIELEDQPTK